jgi:hypothetical protein
VAQGKSSNEMASNFCMLIEISKINKRVYIIVETRIIIALKKYIMVNGGMQ